MKRIRFKEYYPFEKTLIVIALICSIISITLFALSHMFDKMDGYNTLVIIGITLSIGVVCIVAALGNVLVRLNKE